MCYSKLSDFLLNSPSHDVVYHTMSLKKRCKGTLYFRNDKIKLLKINVYLDFTVGKAFLFLRGGLAVGNEPDSLPETFAELLEILLI